MNTRSNELLLYSGDDKLNKNISSCYTTLNTKQNLIDDSIIISHLYFKEDLKVKNLEEHRGKFACYQDSLKVNTYEFLSEDERRKNYSGEEDQIYCGRFPHLNYCGCKFPCSLLLDKIKPIEMTENIYMGPIECAYKTKELLVNKITHVLNVSCTAYCRRNKYFKYLDIYIGDNHTENAIKFFKITNRFIDEAVKSNQKILIHSLQGRSRCWVFLMAYLIGRLNMKFSNALDLIKEKFGYAEPNENFLTQLKHYDLDVNVI